LLPALLFIFLLSVFYNKEPPFIGGSLKWNGPFIPLKKIQE